MADQFHYRCNDCGKTFSQSGVVYLCPECSKNISQGTPPRGVLHIEYDYDFLRKELKPFSSSEVSTYMPVLPIREAESLPPLRVGQTPLYRFSLPDCGNKALDFMLKDDSQNPTFSFKDRASALVSAWAKENGIRTLVAASTGNAGSSLAGICASQHQEAVIFVPAKAPLAKLSQILMHGARIVPVDGTYDQAFDLSIQATEHFGWYNRNTAFNPMTIEGKKTVAFEIYCQMGGMLPDRIFVPVGDGVIISGVYKGCYDLLRLGFIEKIPTIIAVQAKGSSNLVANLSGEQFSCIPSNTIADSISVDIPRNFFMARDYIKRYSGEWLLVDDQEILEASAQLSGSTGIFAEPAAACAFAGFLRYQADGNAATGSKNLVLLTGSGLKDLHAVQSIVHMPSPVPPDMNAVMDYLNHMNKTKNGSL